MSDIAEYVADEHQARAASTDSDGELRVLCWCDGEWRTGWDHARHVAEVTERATRERVRADIEAARPEISVSILVTERRAALRDGMDRAAWIAGGEGK